MIRILSLSFEVFNFGLMGLILVISLFIFHHYGRYTDVSEYTKPFDKKKKLLLLCGFILGIFIPLFTGLMVFYILGTTIRLLKRAPKRSTKNPSRKIPDNSRFINLVFFFGIFFGLLFLFVSICLYLIGFVGRLLSLQIYYPLTTFIGFILGILILKYEHKISAKIESYFYKKVSERTIFALLVLITIGISGIQVGTTYISTHFELPNNIDEYLPLKILTFNILLIQVINIIP
jgi:hypothetical protein